MGVEIERKFLLTGTAWKELAPGISYRQGYLNSAKERTVRVRTIDDKGFLTIKGISVGATRVEYEYEIPVADARNLLDELCEKPIIEKNRYKIPHGGFVWKRNHRTRFLLHAAPLSEDMLSMKVDQPLPGKLA